MRPFTRFRLAIVVPLGLLALSGCVAKDAVIPGYSDSPSDINFSVIDARPAEEKESAVLSLWAMSCDVGIHRIGDDASSPMRLSILRQDIERRLGPQVANKTLTVTRYRMFLNKSRSSGVRSPGLVSALLSPACTRENTSAGWYDPSETTNDNSPIIVEIEATYGGKAYAVRIVSSPDLEMIPSGYRNADQSQSVFAAIEKANLALIEKLRNRGG